MNVRLLNLCLAVFWLALAAAMLAEAHTAERPRFVLPVGGGVSLGWVALAFAAYNLVRWLVLGGRRPPEAPVSRLAHRGPRDGPDEYHPEFDFGRPADPEPPAAPGPRGA